MLKKSFAVVCSIVLAGSLLSACGSSKSVSTNAQAPAKELNVLYATAEADSDAIKAVIPEYEKATGIKIHLDTVPYDNLQQKVFSELANKSSHYDVMAVDTPWMPTLTGKLTPLSKFLKDPKVSKPDQLDAKDFIPKVFLDTSVYSADNPSKQPPAMDTIDVDKITNAGFDIYGLPIQSNVLTLAYRYELFNNPSEKATYKAKYGKDLEVPKTWQEFRDVAKFFTRPDKNLYGTTLMAGSGEWIFCDFKSFLASYSGKVLDDQNKPVFNSPEGIAAANFYNDLINKDKVTPPGTTTFSWDEAATTFATGRTAMTMNYHTLTLQPAVNGKISYALVPGTEKDGKMTYGPHFGTWQLSLNKFGTHQPDAYRFIEWLTSSKTQQEMLKEQLHPTRRSVYEAAKNNKNLAQFENFYDVLGKSLEVGVGRPRISNYTEVSKAVQVSVNNLVTGKGDAKSNLDDAAKNVTQLLTQAGYIK
jgi:multiple sugar transport system substrate-binding protein